jgi:hypothetical protein
MLLGRLSFRFDLSQGAWAEKIHGPCRKLLDAIAALCADTEPKTVPAARTSGAQPTFAIAAEGAGDGRYSRLCSVT